MIVNWHLNVGEYEVVMVYPKVVCQRQDVGVLVSIGVS